MFVFFWRCRKVFLARCPGELSSAGGRAESLFGGCDSTFRTAVPGLVYEVNRLPYGEDTHRHVPETHTGFVGQNFELNELRAGVDVLLTCMHQTWQLWEVVSNWRGVVFKAEYCRWFTSTCSFKSSVTTIAVIIVKCHAGRGKKDLREINFFVNTDFNPSWIGNMLPGLLLDLCIKGDVIPHWCNRADRKFCWKSAESAHQVLLKGGQRGKKNCWSEPSWCVIWNNLVIYYLSEISHYVMSLLKVRHLTVNCIHKQLKPSVCFNWFCKLSIYLSIYPLVCFMITVIE